MSKSVRNYYQNKKNSSKARKIPFELTIDQMRELWKVDTCAYTGLKLTHATEAKQKPTDFTLERVDCSKGYTMENTIVVCYAANAVKAAIEVYFREKSVDVIHSMSKTLKEREAVEEAQQDLSRMQRVVKWMAGKVGMRVVSL
jgi:hypothetical protein